MDKMIVPANFQSWPKLADLLPDQKLIARELWCNQFVRLHGCYELPLGMFSKALNIQEGAVAAALQDFQKRGLVDWDEQTGEVYIRDWLRFHTFKGWAITNYWEGVKSIQSTRLRAIVEEKSAVAGLKDPAKTPAADKSDTCLPTPTPEPTSTSISTSTSTTTSPPPAVGGGGEAQGTLPQPISDHGLDALVEAAIWYAKSKGAVIHREISFKVAVRKRIQEAGQPSKEDLEILDAYRKAHGDQPAKAIPPVSEMKQATRQQLAQGEALLQRVRRRIRPDVGTNGGSGQDEATDAPGGNAP